SYTCSLRRWRDRRVVRLLRGPRVNRQLSADEPACADPDPQPSILNHQLRLNPEPSTSDERRNAMENRFDELTKTLAGEPPGDGAPVSRREALRKVGLGLVGALLASLGMGTAWGDPGGHGGGSGGGGNSPCGVYCRRFSTK